VEVLKSHQEAMRLNVLDKLGVPYDPKRVALLISGLKRRPSFHKELEAYKHQKGGADEDISKMSLSDIPIPKRKLPGDFLGQEARWFVDVLGSPYAQVFVRILFTFLFFLSYVESIPMIGAVISGALDIMLAGGRILIKTVQKLMPLSFGLAPLPYASMIGVVAAAAFGMIVWPLLAIVSFSRQDFTSAIESFVRAIPPPLGDSLADAFLDANRTVYKLNERRKEVVQQILDGLKSIQDLGGQLGTQIQEGTKALTDQLQKAKDMIPKPALPTLPTSVVSQSPIQAPSPPTPTASTTPTPTPPPPLKPVTSTTPVTLGGRHRLSRKKRSQTKWKTSRQRIRSAKRSGSGFR
jgi:hypothetical protein